MLQHRTKIFISVGLVTGVLLLILTSSTAETYRGIWLMPFSFVVAASLMRMAMDHTSGEFQITYAFLELFLFLRLVVTPIFIHSAGPDYAALTYVQVERNGIREAIYLISYEVIAAAAIFFVVSVGYEGKARRRSVAAKNAAPGVRLSGSKIIYGVVALAGVGLLVAWGIPNGVVNFVTIREGTVGTEWNSTEKLTAQIMMIGSWLMFLMIATYNANIYQKKRSRILYFAALMAGIMLILIIIGHRRSIQLYTGIAVASTIIACFPFEKRFTIASIMSAVVFTILSISIWRMVGRHDFATDAASVQFFNVSNMATALQSYTGGPFQIAAANSLLAENEIGLRNVIFDFSRSLFGVNFFVSNTRLLSTEILNLDIYEGKYLTGWLIFTTSYSYTNMGFLFAPFFFIVNIMFAMLTETAMRRAQGIEVRFLFTYLLARMLMFPFNATPLLISFYSLQLFTVGAVMYFAILFKSVDRPYLKRRPNI